jgi:large subunit ribosomal protein L9
MANAELLLLQPVENLGNEGDTITVRAGYARNFLLPKGIAIPVTRANRKQIDALRVRSERRLANELERAQALEVQLQKMTIVFAVKTGPGGKMFGSVTSQDLIEKIAEQGVTLDKKQVSLYTPVKSLGKHSTRVRLHADVSLTLEFEVVSENPIEDAEGTVA